MLTLRPVRLFLCFPKPFAIIHANSDHNIVEPEYVHFGVDSICLGQPPTLIPPWTRDNVNDTTVINLVWTTHSIEHGLSYFVRWFLNHFRYVAPVGWVWLLPPVMKVILVTWHICVVYFFSECRRWHRLLIAYDQFNWHNLISLPLALCTTTTITTTEGSRRFFLDCLNDTADMFRMHFVLRNEKCCCRARLAWNQISTLLEKSWVT